VVERVTCEGHLIDSTFNNKVSNDEHFYVQLNFKGLMFTL